MRDGWIGGCMYVYTACRLICNIRDEGGEYDVDDGYGANRWWGPGEGRGVRPGRREGVKGKIR